MEFLRSFLRRHLVGQPMVASQISTTSPANRVKYTLGLFGRPLPFPVLLTKFYRIIRTLYNIFLVNLRESRLTINSKVLIYLKIVQMSKQGDYVDTLFPFSIAIFLTVVHIVKHFCKPLNKEGT